MTGDLVAGRYRLGGLLGAGGSASVFRAHDVVAEQDVAVRLLHPHLALRADVVAEFLEEAAAARGLDHPHLVRVLDVGTDGSIVWSVAEIVDGVTLDELVESSGPLSEADALGVLTGVLAGLTHAHLRGVLHLDLSPRNVMVPWTGRGPDLTRPRLLDLGARHAAADGPGTVRVSPGFASPEVATGGAVGPAADLYSAGALLVHLLTGQPPFEAAEPLDVLRAQVSAPPPVPSDLVPGLSREVDEIVAWCLAKSPDHRPPTATALSVAVVRARGVLVVRNAGRAVTTTRPAAWRSPVSTREVAPVAPATAAESAPVDRRAAPARGVAALAVLAATAMLGVVAVVAATSGGPGTAAAVTQEESAAAVTPTPTPTSTPTVARTRGAEPDPVPAVVVPDLLGLDGSEAERRLQAAGLVPGTAVFQDGPSPTGTVLASDPAPGAALTAGAVVALVLASGVTVVPEVAGMTPAEARAALTSAGLVVPASSTPEGSLVLGARPEPGGRVTLGASVELLTTPPPSPTPEPSGTPTPTPSPGPSEPGGTPPPAPNG